MHKPRAEKDEILDLRHRLNDQEIRNLLKLAVGYPTKEKVKVICHKYQISNNHYIWGMRKEDQVIGLIGFQLTAKSRSSDTAYRS